MLIYCIKCETANKEGVETCAACGHSLQGEPTEARPTMPVLVERIPPDLPGVASIAMPSNLRRSRTIRRMTIVVPPAAIAIAFVVWLLPREPSLEQQCPGRDPDALAIWIRALHEEGYSRHGALRTTRAECKKSETQDTCNSCLAAICNDVYDHPPTKLTGITVDESLDLTFERMVKNRITQCAEDIGYEIPTAVLNAAWSVFQQLDMPNRSWEEKAYVLGIHPEKLIVYEPYQWEQYIELILADEEARTMALKKALKDAKEGLERAEREAGIR